MKVAEFLFRRIEIGVLVMNKFLEVFHVKEQKSLHRRLLQFKNFALDNLAASELSVRNVKKKLQTTLV